MLLCRDGIDTNDEPLYQMRMKKATQAVREMEQDGSYKAHDKLDSGVSEEDKFSSVKRAGFNSLPARNSGMQNRGGRGRSRGALFQGYRDTANDSFDVHNEARFQRNANSSIKRAESGRHLFFKCKTRQATS